MFKDKGDTSPERTKFDILQSHQIFNNRDFAINNAIPNQI